jgi:hypothetical protein
MQGRLYLPFRRFNEEEAFKEKAFSELHASISQKKQVWTSSWLIRVMLFVRIVASD